jgi:hypothetical protein
MKTGKNLSHTSIVPVAWGNSAMLNETNYKDKAQVLGKAELKMIPRQDFLNLILSDLPVTRQFTERIEHHTTLEYSSLR